MAGALDLVLVVLVPLLVGVAGFTVLTFALAFARQAWPRALPLAFLHEVLATLLVVPLVPLSWVLGARYRPRDGGEPRHGRPVILLHGFLMNRTNWLFLGRRLAARGLGPLYGLSWPTLAGVDEGARRLARFVEEVRAREGGGPVDIVAHSMGGLVARRFIEGLGGAASVHRLVTIATPHRGTRMARFLVGPPRRDLGAPAPVSGPPPGVLYTSIWSRCDNLVVPAAAAHIGAGEGHADVATLDNVIFDDLGHVGLLVSRRVADVVATRLCA